MAQLRKMSVSDLNRLISMAGYNEGRGDPESRVRNYQLAALVTELQIARDLLDHYGVTDKANAAFDAAENPLDTPPAEVA